MTHLYSFLEDFRRDTKSAIEIRRAELGNGWVKASADSAWTPLLTISLATQEISYGPAAIGALDAGVIGDRFYFQNGGDTKETMPLNSTKTRHAEPDATPPKVPATLPTK